VLTSPDLIPFNVANAVMTRYKLFIQPDELPVNTTNILWVGFANYEHEHEHDQVYSFLSAKQKDLIESCCLLQSIHFVIVVFSNENGQEHEKETLFSSDIEWLNDIIPGKWKITTGMSPQLQQSPHSQQSMPLAVYMNAELEQITLSVKPLQRMNPELPLVVSSLCMPMPMPFAATRICVSDLDIKYMNICHCSNFNLHQVRDLKRSLDAASIKVMSINGLFHDRSGDNVFHSNTCFVEQFQKMIHFAKELGATSIIYGGASSKYIHVSKCDEYTAYMKAHAIFVSGIQQLAKSAAKYGITIHVKPNIGIDIKPCNYLFADEQVAAMVAEINCDNVKAGPTRDGILTSYDTFELLEYDGTCFDHDGVSDGAASANTFLTLLLSHID
jgi:hypothetical protein